VDLRVLDAADPLAERDHPLGLVEGPDAALEHVDEVLPLALALVQAREVVEGRDVLGVDLEHAAVALDRGRDVGEAAVLDLGEAQQRAHLDVGSTSSGTTRVRVLASSTLLFERR
jgi:hypothetical protein